MKVFMDRSALLNKYQYYLEIVMRKEPENTTMVEVQATSKWILEQIIEDLKNEQIHTYEHIEGR